MKKISLLQFLGGLYYVCGVILVIGLIFAFRQVKIANKNIKLTQEQLRSANEHAKIASDHIKLMKSYIHSKYKRAYIEQIE